jgi:hypothetical protein
MENASRSIPKTEPANQAIRPPPQPGQLNLQPPAFVDEMLSKALGQWCLFLVCFNHVHSLHAHLTIIKFHSNMSVADAVDQLYHTTSGPVFLPVDKVRRPMYELSPVCCAAV